MKLVKMTVKILNTTAPQHNSTTAQQHNSTTAQDFPNKSITQNMQKISRKKSYSRLNARHKGNVGSTHFKLALALVVQRGGF
jgi:hypothetical protein